MTTKHDVLPVYKPQGLTPFQLIQTVRIGRRIPDTVKIGYAGRLDPMAEGLMLLLLGDENKNRKHYERMDKTYEFEVLFGIETDTYDILGIPLLSKNLPNQNVIQKAAKTYITKNSGSIVQPYPPYSAVRVGGKPLFWWARNQKIHTIQIPEKTVHIHTFNIKRVSTVSSEQLLTDINSRIDAVIGDFRQRMIKAVWRDVLSGQKTLVFPVLSFKACVSSGTYVRSIAHDMGTAISAGALAYSIKRTRIGPYELKV